MCGIGGCALETRLAEDADPNDPGLVEEFDDFETIGFTESTLGLTMNYFY